MHSTNFWSLYNYIFNHMDPLNRIYPCICVSKYTDYVVFCVHIIWKLKVFFVHIMKKHNHPIIYGLIPFDAAKIWRMSKIICNLRYN